MKIKLSALDLGDAIRDGICVADDKGVVLEINRSYEEITSISASEVVGCTVDSLVERGFFTAAVTNEVLATGERVSMMSTIVRNNKRVLLTGVPVFSDSGEITNVLTVMRDITELLHLRSELEDVHKQNKIYLQELNSLRRSAAENEILGESDGIKRLQELITSIAKTDVTVLIESETGTGKELVAREIHRQSDRNDKPYVKMNCAAIPGNLIEAELLGVEGENGKAKPGVFERAAAGTLVLDKIGDLPVDMQSKLLRILHDGDVTRLGGAVSQKVDVRVVATTNVDLLKMVETRAFRADLYYCLKEVPLTIPPLRERKEDIPILAHSFLERFNAKYSKSKRFGVGAVYELVSYAWPGNVRELENTVKQLVVINDNQYITRTAVAEILEFSNRKGESSALSDSMTLPQALETLERELLAKALEKNDSTYKAARTLGISQPTFYRKCRQYGLIDTDSQKMAKSRKNNSDKH